MPGLQSADEVMAKDASKSTIVMIFMSDGGDGVSNPLAEISDLTMKYRHHNFICHTVAFGSDVQVGSSAAKLLEDMTSKGSGKLYYALKNNDLVTTFNSIAADCNVSGTLVDRFADILSKNISSKIIVDYL